MDLNPMTELEAVNIILENDGEAPVATLEENGFDEAARAQRVLREISRTVQDAGWAFNTDFERKFNTDINDEIVLPANTLWVKPTYVSQSLSLVERNRKLYDLERNSFSFTQPVYLNVCQFLDFVELPSAARYYVTIRAARVFQARGTGSFNQNSFTQTDEAMARASLRKADLRARPRGYFRNPANARLLVRRPI